MIISGYWLRNWLRRVDSLVLNTLPRHFSSYVLLNTYNRVSFYIAFNNKYIFFDWDIWCNHFGFNLVWFWLGLVLGSFFYGYWVLQIPGAWVALKIGGTRVFGYGVLLTSLLAIITPIAARYHVMALIGVRIFQGLFLVSCNMFEAQYFIVHSWSFHTIDVCLLVL